MIGDDLCAENRRLRAEIEHLRRQNDELRLRLEESEQAIEAIRTGQVESLVVDGPNGPRIFSLEGADYSYRVLVEAMNEGAATLAEDGTVLYCNARFAAMFAAPLEHVTGSAFDEYLPEESISVFRALLREARGGQSRAEIALLTLDGQVVPAQLSLSAILDDSVRRYCLVATDLRAQVHTAKVVAAERLARSVIEQSEEAIIVCDENAYIIRASAAAERLCGTNPLFQRFDEVFAIEISPHTERHRLSHQFHECSVAEAALRGGVASIAPATLRRSDGICADLLVSANALRDSGNQVQGCVINLVDITELSRAQWALRDSEAQFRFVLENSLDAAYRRDLQNDRYDYLGPAIQLLTGFTVEEMMSMTSDEATSRLHPDDRSAPISARSRHCTTDESRTEYRFRHKDGDYRWLADSAVIVKDETGVPRYRSGVIRDITDRKRQEQLYTVLSQVNEAIVRAHDESTLFYDVCRIVVKHCEFPVVWIGLVHGQQVVRAAAFGPQVDYLSEIRVETGGDFGQGPTGTCIRENRPVINHDFAINPNVEPWRQAAFRHGLRASAAFPLHKDGKVIGAFTLYAGTAEAFDDEQVELFESLCADLSYALIAIEHERKRAETEELLREGDRRKNEFLASLSHELRNPLAPIKNSLYVISRAEPGSDQAKRCWQVIDRQTGQLARLVDDLLDVTRITRNKIQLQRCRLELNELVRLAVEDQQSLFTEANVELELGVAPGAIHVFGDGNRLTQVIGNLLQNSAKFTGRGGTTRVTTSLDEQVQRAVIRIADTGIGISEKDLARLFQPFMQGDKSLDRTQGGLGLGLALVKGIVELHGGEVTATSRGIGKGAEFQVHLPLATDEFSTDRRRERAPIQSRRILVIEDNVDSANTLREVLEFFDHEVTVAYDGKEGLKRLSEFRPEVVFCDIGLPGMDGYEVARAMRATDFAEGIFLVAISGYALPEDLQRAAAAGFDTHLAKPPSLERIEELLNSLPSAGVAPIGTLDASG